MMEPVLNLKKRSSSSPVDFELCIFCQDHKRDDTLRQSSDQGLITVKHVTSSRKKLKDKKYHDVIDRLENVLDTNDAKRLVWHKKCYSQYTDKTKIVRLPDPLDQQCNNEASCSNSSVPSGDVGRTLRKDVSPVNWNMCIFCQSKNGKSEGNTIRTVTTLNLSKQILHNAYHDTKLCIRLAGTMDLRSTGKYHLKCLSSFNRSTARATQTSSDTDLAMLRLIEELHQAADQGHVLRLNDVWQRYVELAEASSTEIPQSFKSRLVTFKDKLKTHIGDTFDFFRPLDRDSVERKTIMIPVKYKYNIVKQLEDSALESDAIFPQYEPEEDIYLSLIHVALSIRSDMKSAAGHQGFSVKEADAISCVPDSLYMFLRILYGGQTTIEEDSDESDDEKIQRKVLCVAQDLVYGISRGKKWTPKHIGLASTLHQATRSKDLVHLFNKAGHCLSYEQVLQVDTSLTEHTLQSMDHVTGAIIPPNIVPNELVFFTADNFDIEDETLTGGDTFHGTQMAVWQRGKRPDAILSTLKPSSNSTLKVPEVIGELCPVSSTIPHKVNPSFSAPVEKASFTSPNDEPRCIKHAKAADLAYFLHRQTLAEKPGWTPFNEVHSHTDPEQTTLGYMPIILAPAHEMDTLNTVVKRCMLVSSHLGQEHTVITVDQALYYKLMELKWSVPEYKDKLIPRLGGLHISMNFLKILGKHMGGSGLAEVWVESNLLGPGTTELVLSGKAYSKGMRAHKLTLQALWRLLMPHLLDYAENKDKECFDEIAEIAKESTPESIADMLSSLIHGPFQQLVAAFVTSKSEESVNFAFWWHYMDMISILLLFTRAQRDGIWELHLHSFRLMLPYFMRYDHYNYARWGPVYLAEMCQLPAAVLEEFQKGNFVVKRSARKFNQVDPDQAMEWINGTGKSGGGIVGITKTISALRRWTLSFNLRSHISSETYEMFHLTPNDTSLHNEDTRARIKRDNDDEDALVSTLRRFSVFTTDARSLQNIATKDLATDAIQDSLLTARELGEKQLDLFVTERLLGIEPKVSIHHPLRKNNAPTLATLYEVVKDSKDKDKRTILKADRNVLQRLITAYEAGRSVDLSSILKHELMPVPVSIAEMNSSLRTGNKAILADILTEGIPCPDSIDIRHQSSCLIVDGQALVVAIGKPADAVTFGDLARTYVNTVLQSGSRYQRIDVVFDRYRDESIKSNTRSRRTKSARPIRRVIESREVPLPPKWSNFLALPANKADLARFLSQELIDNAPPDKEIVVAGGFEDELQVKSSSETTDLAPLMAMHEEADTRVVLHAINSNHDTVVVSARDTDVLLLLVAHCQRVQSTNIWMMSGTSKKRRFIPIRSVFEQLPPSSAMSLIPFHALTGCDVTSYIANHTKRSAWKVFKVDHKLLHNLGVGNLTDETERSAEKFVCRLYNMDKIDSVDEVRHTLFFKASKPEALPPTSDALHFHLLRVHYQSLIWRNADVGRPELPAAETMGWKRCEGGLQPVLMSLCPIPDSCLEIISCSCQTQCRNLRCKCRRNGLQCTAICGCKRPNDNQNPCMNMKL